MNLKKVKVKRLHDDLYLKENRYEKPKESAKFIINLIKKASNKNKNKKFEYLDIGCATGELIYALNNRLSNFSSTGIDVIPKLLRKAKLYNPDSIFYQKDINKKKFSLKKKYDYITLTGVISIFDDFNICLNNIYKLMHNNSKLYIHGHFNPFPYDVYIKYTDKKLPNIYQSGWNILSIDSVKKYCVKKNLKIKIYPFKFKKNLQPNKKDLIRTWTLKYKNKKYFTNGLNLLLSKYFLVISKK